MLWRNIFRQSYESKDSTDSKEGFTTHMRQRDKKMCMVGLVSQPACEFLARGISGGTSPIILPPVHASPTYALLFPSATFTVASPDRGSALKGSHTNSKPNPAEYLLVRNLFKLGSEVKAHKVTANTAVKIASTIGTPACDALLPSMADHSPELAHYFNSARANHWNLFSLDRVMEEAVFKSYFGKDLQHLTRLHANAVSADLDKQRTFLQLHFCLFCKTIKPAARSVAMNDMSLSGTAAGAAKYPDCAIMEVTLDQASRFFAGKELRFDLIKKDVDLSRANILLAIEAQFQLEESTGSPGLKAENSIFKQRFAALGK